MTTYQLLEKDGVVISIRRSDGACIPVEGSNRDYLEYLAWVEAGNIPDPPDPPAPSDERPTIAQRTEALELLMNFLLEPTP